MKEKNPMGIAFIEWFQIFGALMILFTLGIEQSPMINWV